MAIRKRNPRRKRQKKYYPRRVRRMRHLGPSSLNAVPPFKRIKLRYCDTIGINPGLTTANHHTFRISSLYDPDFTGVGHQPMGFDQWATFYKSYVVEKASIRVTFSNTSSASHYLVGLTRSNDSSHTASPTDAMERNNTVTTVLGQKDHSVRTLTIPYNARKHFGVSDLVRKASQYSALMSTNPSDNAFIHVWAADFAHIADPDIVYAQVEIIFTAYLMDRVKLAGS